MIVYVRDSLFNDEGEILNLGFDVDTLYRFVYVVLLCVGVLWMLGDGLVLVFMFDDKMFVWVNGTSVMVVTLLWDDEGYLIDVGVLVLLFMVVSGMLLNLCFLLDGFKLLYSCLSGVEVFDMVIYMMAVIAYIGVSDATFVWLFDGM